jgi:hypothetical protein
VVRAFQPAHGNRRLRQRDHPRRIFPLYLCRRHSVDYSSDVPFHPEQFRTRYPGRSFPDLRYCPDRDRDQASRQLIARLGLSTSHVDPEIGPIWQHYDAARVIGTIGHALPGMDLAVVAAEAGVFPDGEVRIDWYAGEQLIVDFRDLADRFFAFWEPGNDDVAIFTDTSDWLLFVTRTAEVRMIRRGT